MSLVFLVRGGCKVILKNIVERIDTESVVGSVNLDIQDICYDSRQAGKNCLFVALPGFRVDGHQFIPQAFSKGASAFVVEKDVSPPEGATLIKVLSTRQALAHISNIFYDYPSRKIKLVGVTGTKGKTTVTYFLQSIFRQAGVKAGRLSTINYDVGGEVIPASITTPESLDLQRFLKRMLANQVKYAFMEVSSHSLVLHRVEGVDFDWAVFTNLSPEHLDFHENMDNYLKAKLMLFERILPGKKISINVDDESSERIMKKIPCRAVTYAVNREADFRGLNLKMDRENINFDISINGKKERFKIYIAGIHNVYNALAAITVAVGEGICFEDIRRGLKKVKKIPGRLELIQNKANLNIYIDYAHTPSSLNSALSSLRIITPGKLIVVFGCGGDRDPYKRPVMGSIAFKMADFTVVTSDNPRREEPESIISDIEEGMLREGAKRDKDYTIFVDRREAIGYALSKLEPDDTLLVAGKGHETTQIFKDKVIKFDDRDVTRQLLSEGDML